MSLALVSGGSGCNIFDIEPDNNYIKGCNLSSMDVIPDERIPATLET